MLAACGIAAVEVIRKPRVAVLSTGDELIQPGEPLRPAAIYDSNGAIVAAAITEAGGEPVRYGAFPDDEAVLGPAMRKALAECDMLVLSGGTSKGAGDLSHSIVPKLGRPGILVHGVALKPGKPLCLAVADRKAGRGAAGLSDLRDLHLPCFRRAGDPAACRPAAGKSAPGRSPGTDAGAVRTWPQGIRAGRTGPGRGFDDRLSLAERLRVGDGVFAGRWLYRDRCAGKCARCRDHHQGYADRRRRARARSW